MPIRKTIDGGHVPVHVYTEDVADNALSQLANIAQLSIVHHHVAAMPDVHWGIGATVGSIIPTRGAIIPAAVGVDIGCGMNALRLSLDAAQLPDSLRRVRSAIERAVPVGVAQHATEVAPAAAVRALAGGLAPIVARHPGLVKMVKHFERTWPRQIGTLGGGNHFIELCLDEVGAVWIMLHSGSRGIGNAVGRHFIALAKQDMEQHLARLPDADLAYFREGAQHFDDYVRAVAWAQDYARMNREQMMRQIVAAIRPMLPPFEATAEAINCHHNYVAREHHFDAEVYVTRKGAIRAGRGEFGIIPGSMGARSYIVRGKGNADAFDSCAHGAGRRMSRAAAKRRFSALDLAQQTRGVECRKDRGVVDEIPAAYKSIDQVMHDQAELVDVVHTLRQVVCVKG